MYYIHNSKNVHYTKHYSVVDTCSIQSLLKASFMSTRVEMGCFRWDYNPQLRVILMLTANMSICYSVIVIYAE